MLYVTPCINQFSHVLYQIFFIGPTGWKKMLKRIQSSCCKVWVVIKFVWTKVLQEFYHVCNVWWGGIVVNVNYITVKHSTCVVAYCTTPFSNSFAIKIGVNYNPSWHKLNRKTLSRKIVHNFSWDFAIY